MAQHILLTGATGYIGGRLAPRLLDRGHTVRCLVRDPDRLTGLDWTDRVEIAQGDVLRPETLTAAMEGIDTAYYLIHSMAAGEGFAERDRRAAENFGLAAKAAGVNRVIYLGGIEPAGSDSSVHLSSRIETGEVLRQAGPPLTEFRAAVIVGSGSASFELIRHLTERVPVMITPKWVLTRTQPIAIRDVLCYLMDALELPETAGRVIEIGGPEVLTYEQMFRTYADVRGLGRLVVHVPFLTPKLSSLWAGLVTPISPAIARPLIEGLKSEVVVKNPEGQALFDVEPIPYEAAVRLALERFRQNEVETSWSGSLSSSLGGKEANELTSEKGMIRDRRELVVNASPESVFVVVKAIGGETGWLYGNPLWWIRGVMDQFVGGPGLRRGRRNRSDVRVGEAIDFWRVEEIEENRLLRLRAEMKLPGRAWLQFEIEPEPSPNGTPTSRIVQTAFYEPKGLLGLAYWYAILPVHPSIFKGMIRELGRRAEKREAAAKTLEPEAA
ncbi:MAG: SDR family oxidoreductase [Bacteroidota bacterium]